MLKPDFKLFAEGTVVSIIKEKPKTDEREAQPAGLQFISENERKIIMVDIKVLDTVEKDLEHFLDKKVRLDSLQIFQVNGVRYYRLDDISLISVLGPTK